MQLPECMRSSTFRWTLLATGLLAAVIAALLGFVYWKTKDDLTMRSDRMIASQLDAFAALSPERRLDAINERSEAGSSSCSARRIVWPRRPQDRR